MNPSDYLGFFIVAFALGCVAGGVLVLMIMQDVMERSDKNEN